MTTPDPLETLQSRVEALESDYFALVEKMRKVSQKAERNAVSLDELEEVLDDVSTSSAENAQAMAAALQQRQAQLDNDPLAAPADPAPTTPVGVGQLAAPAAAAAPGGGPGPGAAGTGQTEFPDMDELRTWVADHIAPMVRKTTTTGEGGGIRWCRRWWEHIDAVERVIALYLAWGELSADDSATWLSVFLRDHLDPHFSVLTSPYGPFYACSPRKHSDASEALGQAELIEEAGPPAPWPSTPPDPSRGTAP